MSGLCLAAAALTVALPIQSFTLAWTHSIEKIRWEEDYRVEGKELILTEARILGTGAGMEPPEGSVLKDGVYHYHPAVRTVPRLNLARSGYVADYEMCWDGQCRTMREIVGPEKKAPTIEVSVCE